MEKDLIQQGNIIFAPVLHGRLEFSVVVRRLFKILQPDAVAVEFPATIRKPLEKGLDRLPFISVVVYQEKDGRYVYLPLEPQDALVEAGRLARKHGVDLHFVDRDTEGYSHHRDPMPDSYAVRRLGLKAYAKAYHHQVQGLESTREDQLREMTMAYHLQQLSSQHEKILFVCGMAHYPKVMELLDEKLALPIGRAKRDGVTLANLAAESIREILSEMPYLARHFVDTEDREGEDPDRLDLHHQLIAQAREAHYKNSKEEISPAQMVVLNKFARNYAMVQGGLTPDLYQLLIAARGAVDDNFSYEVWDIATTYPWQDEDSGLPELKLRGEDLYLDSKKIRFYRSFRQFRRRLVPVPAKQRKKENKPGEWKEGWQGRNICSYPPEDIVIEGFGDYLKKKTVQVLSEENQRVLPFQTSMLDGIDMRETIRNWHEGRLYVSENRKVQGKVGSVVLIFDEDASGDDAPEKYPWRMTWIGEHDQESDMAFYASPAGEQVIGPGISRCEYGGFMMSYPPMRMYDIWRDPFFNGAKTKAERLLLAGIDYSEEKLIAYIAAKPPSDRVKSFATLHGKKVVYLPVGQFSPVTLKKTRIFHVLDGHKVRGWAPDYIY